MIKISFVISAFNVENYIGKTLNTLLSQENKDFDVLIIDDGSTDNTNLIITEFIKKNDNITEIFCFGVGLNISNLFPCGVYNLSRNFRRELLKYRINQK